MNILRHIAATAAIFLLPALTAAAQQYHDAANNDALGPVRCIVTNNNATSISTLCFDAEGRVADKDIADARYDPSGRMTACRQRQDGHWGDVTFTYDAQGRIASQRWTAPGGYMLTEVVRDAQGLITSATTTVSCDGEEQSITLRYSRHRFDTHGNWVERLCDIGQESFLERRTILYR